VRDEYPRLDRPEEVRLSFHDISLYSPSADTSRLVARSTITASRLITLPSDEYYPEVQQINIYELDNDDGEYVNTYLPLK
jgi:hypothetical protein